MKYLLRVVLCSALSLCQDTQGASLYQDANRITVLMLRSGTRAVGKDALARFDLIGSDALKLHSISRGIGSLP